MLVVVISRTAAMTMHERAVVLAAALSRGVGRRTAKEQTVLVMQEAEDDLHAAVLKALGPGTMRELPRSPRRSPRRCTRTATSAPRSSKRSSKR